MGSPYAKPQDLKLDWVPTDAFKDKLNRIYDLMRACPRMHSTRLFDYLREVKELAVVEKKSLIQVPSGRLDELSAGFNEIVADAARSN